LADAGLDSRASEGDPPIMDVAIVEFQLVSASRQNEVVRGAFVVIQEIVFDCVGAMPQAKNEVLMAIVGIVLHNMTKNRSVADLHLRLRKSSVPWMRNPNPPQKRTTFI
jgi:hypothetical protein